MSGRASNWVRVRCCPSAVILIPARAAWEGVYAYLRAQGFEVDERQVEMMIARLHVTYAVYYRFIDANYEFCVRHGYLRTPILGRIVWLGKHPKPQDVAAVPVQAMESEIMGERLLEIDRQLAGMVDTAGEIPKQIIYQYDSATYETPLDLVEPMTSLIRRVWSRPVVLKNGQSWVQPIDLKVANRWSDL